MAVSTDASYVYVNGGTYTLDELYVAEGGTTIVKSGAGPYTYTIQGNRCLRIYGGATVNISNSGDTLTWTGVSSSKTILEIGSSASTGTLTATTNVTIDANGNTTYYNYCYTYGNSVFQGTAGNEVEIVGFWNWRWIFKNYSGITDWDYVIIRDPDYVASSNYLLFFADGRELQRPHTFDHVTISNVAHSDYAFYFYCGDYSMMTFNYIDINGKYYGPVLVGSIIKFSNSTWKNIYANMNIIGGNARNFLYSSTGVDNVSGKNVFNQPKITFDTCTFQDNFDSSSTERAFGYVTYDAIIKFKNCTFAGVDDASSYGASSYYNSRFLYEGTTTFTNCTANREWAGYGSHYDVFALTMTVYDVDGNAIHDAMVDVYQIDEYERWSFRTNSSGQVKDVFSDDPVFVYREILSNTPTYDYWSNSISGGKYHKILVYKEGYQPWSTKVAFDENKIINAHLFPIQSVVSLKQG